MLYAYGLGLGLRLAARGQWHWGLRLAVCPVSYWRHAEYRLALDALNPRPGMRVLDVGSPKLLALYLSRRYGARVTATDVNPYFLALYRRLRALEGLDEQRLTLETQDGRQLPYPDASFDAVYALSVLEHIPGEGDAACARELGRVLKPGGRCVVTVPFAPQAHEQTRRADFYWAARPESSEGEVFYQRRYDEAALRQRLIEPSGLRAATVRYLGERIAPRAAREVADVLPLWAGPLHPLAARLCLTPPCDDWRRLAKPLCAALVLEKPQ